MAALFLLVTVILWFIFGHFFDRKEYMYFKNRKKREKIHNVENEGISELKDRSKDEIMDESKDEINGGSKD